MTRGNERRVLRSLEHATLVFERFVNHLTDSRYNFFYHTGTIAVWLLTLVGISGVLLLLIYFTIFGIVPDVAFASIERLNDFWLGRLTRSVHRYAADLSVIFITLHAFRMFVMDRFAESRWLAWVSGIVLVLLVLLIGTLGFWLVGDTRAEWIGLSFTRVMGGPIAFSFLTNEEARNAFYLFFVILVFHIGLGLFVALFYWIHTLRLSRAQLLPPRVWIYAATGVLLGVALIHPAPLPPSADLSRLLTETLIDPFFLLFLPALQDWGVSMFVVVSILLFVAPALFPWLFPRREPKAEILKTECTGCTLCALDCPYAAIEMRPRTDQRAYRTEAVVIASRCTSCGICIGSCSWDAIRMGGLSATGLEDRMTTQTRYVIACERHAAQGALRALNGMDATILRVPCAGAIHPDVIQCAQGLSQEPVVVLGCLGDDCPNREGSRWLDARLNQKRAPALSKDANRERLRVLWTAPDDAGAVRRTIIGENPRRLPQLQFVPGLILLAGLFFAAVFAADFVFHPNPPNVGELKVALAHGGNFRETAHALSPLQMSRLPAGVTAEQVLGVARFPVYVEMDLDGAPRLRQAYSPSGLRQDGLSYVLEEIILPPGDHRVEIRVDEQGGSSPRQVFSGVISIKPGQVRVLSLDSRASNFVLR